jgi:hypothetical protein
MSDSKLVSFKKLCYGAQFKYSVHDAAVWVKIGHNTVAGWNPKYVSDSWAGQPICAFAEHDQLDTDVFLVTPAPAEDVRAVVEEPAGFELIFDGKQYDVTGERGFGEFESQTYLENGFKVAPLYRHPQRPVVLPERIIGQQHGDKIAEAEQRGWNACLDAVEELNK